MTRGIIRYICLLTALLLLLLLCYLWYILLLLFAPISILHHFCTHLLSRCLSLCLCCFVTITEHNTYLLLLRHRSLNYEFQLGVAFCLANKLFCVFVRILIVCDWFVHFKRAATEFVFFSLVISIGKAICHCFVKFFILNQISNFHLKGNISLCEICPKIVYSIQEVQFCWKRVSNTIPSSLFSW